MAPRNLVVVQHWNGEVKRSCEELTMLQDVAWYAERALVGWSGVGGDSVAAGARATSAGVSAGHAVTISALLQIQLKS